MRPLSVVGSTEEILSIPEVGTDTTTFEVNEIITAVTVVNDVADIYGEGALVAKLEYP